MPHIVPYNIVEGTHLLEYSYHSSSLIYYLLCGSKHIAFIRYTIEPCSFFMPIKISIPSNRVIKCELHIQSNTINVIIKHSIEEIINKQYEPHHDIDEDNRKGWPKMHNQEKLRIIATTCPSTVCVVGLTKTKDG